MISMRTKQEIIIRYFREGLSKRKIAEQLGIHRKTVNRYIELYEEARQRLGSLEAAEEHLVEALTSAPKYDSSKRQKRKLTQEVTHQVDGPPAVHLLDILSCIFCIRHGNLPDHLFQNILMIRPHLAITLIMSSTGSDVSLAAERCFTPFFSLMERTGNLL